jgi:hypothetical protein
MKVITDLTVTSRPPRPRTAWTARALFAGGEAGAWFEPGPTTCFTDTAGTTAAGVGDAVARINDLSGNGNHATQTTAAARPILRQTAGGLYYLETDGVDDFMTTPAMDFTASAQAHMVTAFRTDTPISINSPVMLFGGDLINGSLWFNTGSGSIDTLQGYLRGTASVLNNPRVNITSPRSFVVSHKGDLAAPQANQIEFRVDGVDETGTVNADASGTTFGNHALTLFENPRTSAHFFGRFYGGLILDRTLTTDELAQTETYHAEKVGVTLP